MEEQHGRAGSTALITDGPAHVFDAQGRRRGRHGTPSGYTNGKCRCDPCTWAWASRRRGDDPIEAAPVWLDEWAGSAGAL